MFYPRHSISAFTLQFPGQLQFSDRLLETKLSEDVSGEYRKELTDQLSEELQQVKQEINGGLPPNEFSAVQSYQVALEAALKTVETVWNSEQKLSNRIGS